VGLRCRVKPPPIGPHRSTRTHRPSPLSSPNPETLTPKPVRASGVLDVHDSARRRQVQRDDGGWESDQHPQSGAKHLGLGWRPRLFQGLPPLPDHQLHQVELLDGGLSAYILARTHAYISHARTHNTHIHTHTRIACLLAGLLVHDFRIPRRLPVRCTTSENGSGQVYATAYEHYGGGSMGAAVH
jgi:hypothetical protein